MDFQLIGRKSLVFLHQSCKQGRPLLFFQSEQNLPPPSCGKISCGYGNYIVTRYSDRKTSLFGHLSGLTVNYGEYVNADQVIGYVGYTGYCVSY